jgi:uroporphyrinogen III methyltransferase/synthase
MALAWMPPERRDAEGLLAELQRRGPVSGRRFLIPQAEGARTLLAAGLRDAGAHVQAPIAYRTVAAEVDAEALRERLIAGRLDVLTFTSPSTVEHFLGHLDDESRKAAAECTIGAIGPVTEETLRREGLAPDVVPERAGARELVAALAQRGTRGGDR